MRQWHRVQQIVVRSIRDYTLVQRKCVSKLTFALDPEALLRSYRWVHHVLKSVALSVLKIQRYRLKKKRRDVGTDSIHDTQVSETQQGSAFPRMQLYCCSYLLELEP